MLDIHFYNQQSSLLFLDLWAHYRQTKWCKAIAYTALAQRRVEKIYHNKAINNDPFSTTVFHVVICLKTLIGAILPERRYDSARTGYGPVSVCHKSEFCCRG